MARLFGFISILIVVAVGMYIYSKQVQSSSSALGGSNPKAAIDITGVKNDLIGIAGAERRYFATENKYASLDELVSNNYITVRGRAPYSYEVQTSAEGFRVVATRSGDDASGLPAQLSVDETMTFQQSQ